MDKFRNGMGVESGWELFAGDEMMKGIQKQ